MVQLGHPSEDMPQEIIEPDEHDLSAPEDVQSLSDGSNRSLVENPEVYIDQTEKESDEPIDECPLTPAPCEPEDVPDLSSHDSSRLKKKDKKKISKKKTKVASVSAWDDFAPI